MRLAYDLFKEMFPFWKDLTEEEKEEIVQNTNVQKRAKGDLIHGGGSDCTGVIGIKSGRLRTYLLSDEGKEVTLFRLLPGDCCILSASCMMKNISFDVQVSVEEDAEILVINPASYSRISGENIAVSEFTNGMISTRFSEAMWVMEQVLFMKLDRRLAIFLLEQAAIEGGDTIHLTHQEIADHMGSAREVVSRMLKYFAAEGLLTVSRKDITLLNREALRNMM